MSAVTPLTKSARHQRIIEIVTTHPVRSQTELADLLVAGALGEGGHGAHPERSRSQVRTAFCACRRFSASSQTTDCGPSMTRSEISLPR